MLIHGEYYLITCDAWFAGPDGEEYRAVWGKCEIIETKESFGFTPLRPSTNWYCKVGEGEKSVIVAGCQIHYAVKCDIKPILRKETYLDDMSKVERSFNRIWLTE